MFCIYSKDILLFTYFISQFKNISPVPFRATRTQYLPRNFDTPMHPLIRHATFKKHSLDSTKSHKNRFIYLSITPVYIPYNSFATTFANAPQGIYYRRSFCTIKSQVTPTTSPN